MKYAQILLTTSMLMAGTFATWANQTVPIQNGISFYTCQAGTGGDVSDPSFLTIPSSWSDPNGNNNTVLYWPNNCPTTGFSQYQYFTGADADNYFLNSGSPSGWYDGVGVIFHATWSPGQGVMIRSFIASSSLTFIGATPGSTTFTPPSSGICLRGSPTPNTINAGYTVPEDIIATPQNGDAIYVWKLTGLSFPQDFDFYYYDSNQGGWVPRTGTIPPYAPHITPIYQSAWVGKITSTVIEGNVTRKNSSCGSFIPATLPNWVVQAQDISSGAIYYGITGGNSRYAIQVPAGPTYTVTAQPLSGWTSCGVSSYAVTATPGSFSTANNFTVYATDPASTKDLAVDLVSFFPYPLRSPCADQQMTYVISYRNSGTMTVNGTKVILHYPPTQIPGVSSFPGFTEVRTFGQVTWTKIGAGALGAKASGNLKFTVQLPSTPTTGPISATAEIKPFVSDYHLADNTSILDQQITCSHDPNDLLVTPQGCGSQGFIAAGQPLTYLVRFQNTGNGPAYQVVVSNKLSANLDLSTLQVIGSSHPNVLQVQGQQLVWTFPNIYLPAQSADDLGSQGYIKYQVLPLGSASTGTVITNRAEIYFDLNAPVLTVTTTNTITASPAPVASFTVAPQVGSTGHTNDFTYTGGNTGATYLWNFGPDATPSTSTAQNPAGIVFNSNGDKMVTLQVSLGACPSDPAVQIITVGVPLLSAEVSNGQFVLSWQGNGYHLQERGDLQPGTPWTATSGTVTQVESDYGIALPADNSEKYYRLSQVAP